MIERYEIIDHDVPRRPDAERIVFCDGTGGPIFRRETDIELSHWRPNVTPVRYRAGTSTEICFRFLDSPLPGRWTAAVNNHVDVDGILSVYVLVKSDHALAHRNTIIAAAEIGDFWGWGEPEAQRLFQGITRIMKERSGPRSIYEEAFQRIPGLVDGSDPQTDEIEKSLLPLRRGAERVEQGRISRTLSNDRLAHYVIPVDVAGDDDVTAAYVPGFNEAISPLARLWPQVRARRDAERVCLVSTERRAGWFHDLCYPGYLWADTEGKWLPPGFSYGDGMSRYVLDNERLIAATDELQQVETAPGHWELGGTGGLFEDAFQGQFPVVGRFVDERGQPAASQLTPDEVLNHWDASCR